jgi:excinuclease ABC subunit A
MALMKDSIKILGAREHNLKDLDLEIPKNRMVVFGGVSGFGEGDISSKRA